jgi:hypothetical protein
MRKATPFVYLMVLLLSGCGPSAKQAQTGTTPEKTEVAPAPSIVGAWEVFADDDKPGVAPDREVLVFYDTGLFLMDGQVGGVPAVIRGVYDTAGGELSFTMSINGMEATLSRGYKVEAGNLLLANENQGFARYKPLPDFDMTPWKRSDFFDEKSVHRVTAKVPSTWTFEDQLLTDGGSQVVAIRSGNGTKTIVLMMTSKAEALRKGENLASLFKKALDLQVKQFPDATQKRENYVERFNRKGMIVTFENIIMDVDGKKVPLPAGGESYNFGWSTPEGDHVVVIVFHPGDRLGEIEAILNGLKITPAAL